MLMIDINKALQRDPERVSDSYPIKHSFLDGLGYNKEGLWIIVCVF